MSNHRKSFWLALITSLLLTTALFAGCSSNTPDDVAPTKPGNTESGTATEDPIANVEEDVEKASDVAEFFDDAIQSSASSGTTDALPANAEIDTNGVPVGFTENGNPYRGNPDAPVVIEEFSDFQ